MCYSAAPNRATPPRISTALTRLYIQVAGAPPQRPRGSHMANSTTASPRLDNERKIRAPRGDTISAKTWQAEAAMRMLMNNLDAEVAERPQELVVYGG